MTHRHAIKELYWKLLVEKIVVVFKNMYTFLIDNNLLYKH